ncbi:MAG TPA: response regulator transcription factor [Actinomycetota bacterium]|nr:response regulator transcription factor [Actinomycetota bacterium]
MNEPVKVLLADDHPSTRAGVRFALEAADMVVCAEVGDAPSAVAAAERERPDLCLLDIHMPGGGIVAAHAIARKVPEAAVVMLTVSREDEDLFAALRAGARGYLLKDMDPDRLAAALRGVLSGEAAMPRAMVSRVMEEFRTSRRQPGQGRGAKLSSREWEVLEAMGRGMTTSEIADTLYLSKATVRSHVASILKKLQVPDRDAAVRLLKER